MIRRFGIIAMIAVGVLFGRSHRSLAATLSIAPSSGAYTVGQSFTVTLKVNAAGQAINASEGTITWSSSVLSLKGVSAGGSIFQFWAVQPSGSDATGRVIFSGGLPSPGYSGSGGTIIKLTFTAKTAGTAAVKISGGKVLANDGLGTDLLTGQGQGSYTLRPASPTPTPEPTRPNRPTPTLTVPEFPDQSAWYRGDRATVTFSRPAGIEGVSYVFDQQAGTAPPEIIKVVSGSIALTVPTDGLWSIHLRGKYSSGWSSTTHYILRRDATAPEPFTLSLDRTGADDPAPQLTWSATDAASGVAAFTLSLDGAVAQTVTSPAALTIDQAGHHRVVVTATDQAGNSAEASLDFDTTGYPAPVITSVSSPLLLLDPLVVRGTASAGDTITVYVNNQSVGEVIAGPVDPSAQTQGVTIRTPWILTSDRFFRPGTYQVTATATSPEKRHSAPTKPQTLQVIGQAVLLRGRPVLTISVVTPLAVLTISFLTAIIGVLLRLWLAWRAMHRRVNYAEEELEALREFSHHQSVTRDQLDSALQQIETDLGTLARPKPKPRRARRSSRP